MALACGITARTLWVSVVGWCGLCSHSVRTLGLRRASRLFDAGRNAASAVLGHHSPAFTLTVYVHLLDGDLGDVLSLPDSGHVSGRTVNEVSGVQDLEALIAAQDQSLAEATRACRAARSVGVSTLEAAQDQSLAEATRACRAARSVGVSTLERLAAVGCSSTLRHVPKRPKRHPRRAEHTRQNPLLRDA
jgi:hypothetical protein